ncbi:MAG: 7-cyano-7-deazaguanine synthase QueC [Actinobacteria bacterium]|nr:7-cyano-7-deazaguanine synthase QueC [Actinomycetota bacterium]
MEKKAVVLSSGGIDSTTTLAITKSEGYKIHSISFNYGQRHIIELEKAKKIAEYFKVEKHIIVDVDLRKIGGSALTAEVDVPKERNEVQISREIPVTYVPARNVIFLSIASALAESIGSSDIFIGVSAIDYSGYPDCRPEFISSFEKMINLATKAGVEGKKLVIHAPLANLTKGEIIRKGIELGVDYSITHSCYDPVDGKACGKCDSCILRLKGFKEAGTKDPVEYVWKGHKVT